jgi:hypothetical protein
MRKSRNLQKVSDDGGPGVWEGHKLTANIQEDGDGGYNHLEKVVLRINPAVQREFFDE